MANEILTLLQKATHNLLYMSESDAPFEVVHWKNGKDPLDPAQVLALSGHEKNTPIKEMPFDEFFKNLIKEKNWYGEREKERVRKYKNLFAVIQEHLSDIKVFAIGKTQVDLYIVGLTRGGEWVGVKTQATET